MVYRKSQTKTEVDFVSTCQIFPKLLSNYTQEANHPTLPNSRRVPIPLATLPLQNNSQLMPPQSLVVHIWIIRNHPIRTLHIRIIIQPPVRPPNLPRRMENPCPHIVHHHARPNRHAYSINGLDNPINNVRRRLEKIRVQQIEQVQHSVFAAEPHDAEGNVLDD